LHDEDRAIADFTETIRIKKSTVAYKRRAAAYSLKGDYTRALVDLRDAAKAAPNDGAALINLAWFLATCPEPSLRDGNEAVTDATKACEISHWKNGYAIDALAAACAETGNFDLALSYENEAIDCDNVTKASNVEMEKRRALYLTHKAFHKQEAR
jgi:tetratricopeptide (TPR) repeat protein